ncbi:MULTISPECIES: LysR family transcriptional regulator [Arthrobacter]|uniref:LysR substrate-binding domain-containing protein n=2 Tax=Arthrobacter TaxID=1663 RepID=A0ABU9KHH5_9MICC|nr:LysR family transcriptional regulator [Arthrobacter sp. YJM1]MDP5226652.1 LysR substrate-binding domain-containing protein [Arthrobacter sp. YJM1]
MDVNTRRLRYFVAVAEELHFSRAAARLFVAQQALSKQIRELESELGLVLLNRTTRKVELTEDGERFLAVARAVLAEWDDGLRRVRQASRAAQRTLRLGFVVGAALELTRPLLAEFSRRHPEIELHLQEASLSDPSCGLADGSSDLAILRPPLSLDGLKRLPLFVEPVVACLSAAHPLAGRSMISPAELLDEPLTVGGGHDAAWRAFWTLSAFRTPEHPARTVETSSPTEETELVASGVATALTAAASARYLSRPGLVYVPVEPHPGSEVALAWRADAASEAVGLFVEVAREVRDAERDLIRAIEHPAVVNPG